jgi:CheY-like chemotaxis protein
MNMEGKERKTFKDRNKGGSVVRTLREGRSEVNRPRGAAPGRDIILIVDDQESVRSCLSRMLSASGFHVQTAGSGEEALHLFSGIRFALVLTDFNMPGMNGLTLAAKIRDLSPETPVILMTGSDVALRSEENHGVVCVLRKPFKWQDLDDSILAALTKNGAVIASEEGAQQ